MNYILDILLIAIAALIIFRAWSKGFSSSFLSLASFVISAIASWVLHPPLASYLDKAILNKPIVELISNKITQLAESGDTQTLFSDMPQSFKQFLDSFGIDPTKIEGDFANSTQSATEFVTNLATDIASSLSYLISCAISIICIYLITMLICIILSLIIKKIVKLPVLHSADKILGLIIGVISSSFFLWMTCNVLALIVNGLFAIYTDNQIVSAVQNSFVIKIFSSFNPFAWIFG